MAVQETCESCKSVVGTVQHEDRNLCEDCYGALVPEAPRDVVCEQCGVDPAATRYRGKAICDMCYDIWMDLQVDARDAREMEAES